MMAEKLIVNSPSFKHMGTVPKKYTCDGNDVNPALKISGIPAGAKSLVLIVDDPDAPARTWLHWLVWDISPKGEIKEGVAPGIEGLNSFRRSSYGGPCPPSGVHRYFFKVFALDVTKLGANPGAGLGEVESLMKNHVIAKGELMATYSRQ